jgi:hypothetical protein
LSAMLAISRAWVQLNPYKRFCWNRAAVLQLLAHEDEAKMKSAFAAVFSILRGSPLPSSRHNKRHDLDKRSERHNWGGQQHVLGEHSVGMGKVRGQHAVGRHADGR